MAEISSTVVHEGGEHPVAQYLGGDQGAVPQAALGHQEHGQQGCAAGQQAQDSRAGEPVGAGQIQADQDGDRPGRQQGDPRVIETVLRGAGPALRDPALGDEHGERRHRQVHEEHQPPGGHVGEPAAQQRAHRVPESGDAQDQPAGQPFPVRREEGDVSPRMRQAHISAPPTPISARQAMSSPTSGATPHSSENTAKMKRRP